ncbi:DoxX protein [Caulobacter sp. 17J80-11]|uniref:DoxX protein n=1 Tax=Caulobacter sp. 17J80-11 TaxID=2763502 RepID=UPI001653CAAB|nr:DoxX protein [Caulobacter sp. 17J80-11]MBC6982644.1 DoxX protein [Caulobacter sp. 17J80-11]
MTMIDRAWIGLRWLYALFFIATAAMITTSLTTGAIPRPVQATPAAAAFDHAIAATGFVDPALAACYLLGGLALLRERTTPFGLVLLAPVVAVILLFHIFLSGLWPVGAATAAVAGLLAWRHRGGFTGLWSYRRA